METNIKTAKNPKYTTKNFSSLSNVTPTTSLNKDDLTTHNIRCSKTNTRHLDLSVFYTTN